jgi:hypothetical protein
MTETSPTGRPDTAPDGSGTDRIKACDTAACIQVKFLENGNVLIGSTEHVFTLNFTRAEWVAFAEGIKAGEFDYLI